MYTQTLEEQGGVHHLTIQPEHCLVRPPFAAAFSDMQFVALTYVRQPVCASILRRPYALRGCRSELLGIPSCQW